MRESPLREAETGRPCAAVAFKTKLFFICFYSQSYIIKTFTDMAKIIVQDTEVTVVGVKGENYICITDLARYKNAEHTDDIIKNWIRNRNTIELLGIWELLHNPKFKPVEFDGFRQAAGLNGFVMTPKRWTESTNAIGIISKPGRYGGTYAHTDIALEFASWISIEFKLYLLKEFQRLKAAEQAQIGWSVKRELSKINYRIHTHAIKCNLIPAEVTPAQAGVIYACEADVLNVALFGLTAKQWRDAHPDRKGNLRDYATINELICLSNLENLNAALIDQALPQRERLLRLNKIAIHQMQVLEDTGGRKLLK